jgi:hypothetical protein
MGRLQIFATVLRAEVAVNPVRQVVYIALGSMLLCGSCIAWGQTTSTSLPIRPKIAATDTLRAAPSPPQSIASREAPFASKLGEEPPILLPLSPVRDAGIPGSCAQAGDSLCYDYRQGRVVYKPARKLMPEISGLKRESLSVKRDKVTLNYSFK